MAQTPFTLCNQNKHPIEGSGQAESMVHGMDDPNFSEINLGPRPRTAGATAAGVRGPSHRPSPLQHQAMRRSPSVGSSLSRDTNGGSSGGGGGGGGDSGHHYIVSLAKTPLNLTPSQRLSLRKLQLSESISRFKQPELGRVALRRAPSRPWGGDHDDEEVDAEVCMFNVPLLQPMALATRERFTYSRHALLKTDLTRSSLILSSASGASSHTSVGDATFSVEDLHLSRDAEHLTRLFNRDDRVLVNEEARQRQQLLRGFTKTPPAPPAATAAAPAAASPGAASFLSFTRPTWLPPKAAPDRTRHHLEARKLVLHACRMESEQRSARVAQLEHLKRTRERDRAAWENEVLPGAQVQEAHYAALVQTARVRDMYWRGLPTRAVRSRVWWRQIGNALQLSPHTCGYYFAAAARLRQRPSPLVERIRRDLRDTFPDLNVFQSPLTSASLTDIVLAVVILVNELNQGAAVDSDFANLDAGYYFAGLTNVAAMLHLHYGGDRDRTFILAANLYQRSLPNLLMAYMAQGARGRLTAAQLAALSGLVREALVDFNSQLMSKLPRLAVHFSVIGLEPLEFVPTALCSLFSNLFDFSLSCHLLDIYVFEGDSFLVSCQLALLQHILHKLYGTKAETLAVLEHRRPVTPHAHPETYSYLHVGLEHEFIDKIRQMAIIDT